MSWQHPPPPPDMHARTQLHSQGCNGHKLWVVEAGATEWTNLYGNAHIRLNIAVFWDIMLCHCVSLFLMLLRTIASEMAETTCPVLQGLW
jgi:hypothetical protein